MKKIFSIIFAILILSNAFVTNAVAAEYEEKSWTTSFDEVTGTLTVSGTGRVEGLYPDNILRTEFMYDYDSEDDYSVKKIIVEDGITCIAISFSRLKNLEEVVLPDTLTEIEGSFNKCENLTSIVIPESVEKIWNDSFCDCDKLSEITFEGPVSIGAPWGDTADYNFCWLPSLKKVEIPDKSFIGGAFNYCENLNKVTLNGMVDIGKVGDSDSGYNKSFFKCHNDLVVYTDNGMTQRNIYNSRYEGNLDFEVVNTNEKVEEDSNRTTSTNITTEDLSSAEETSSLNNNLLTEPKDSDDKSSNKKAVWISVIVVLVIVVITVIIWNKKRLCAKNKNKT